MATPHAPSPPDPEAAERTLGQLVADASREVSELVRHEVALAKAELRTDVRNGALAGGLFAVAGYLGLLATVVLCIAAGFGLTAAGLPAWAAFLLVAGGLLLLAALLALVGKSRIGKLKPPERTIRSARETFAAVRRGSRTDAE